MVKCTNARLVLQIIIGTVISWQVNLNKKFGVDVVGTIPSGSEHTHTLTTGKVVRANVMHSSSFPFARLQAPVVPEFSRFGEIIGDAFALAFVGYGIAISLGRTFALKYGYSVDSNQVRR